MSGAEEYRQALVNIVNILGAPRECPSNKCEGCTHEQVEACSEGLRALGHLAPIEWVPDPTGEFSLVAKEPIPDPLDAWERFMETEFGVTLSADWRNR